MLHELCITVTMRLVALGHSLYEAQYLAGLIVLQLVLLCTLLGYRVVPLDEVQPVVHTVARTCIAPLPGSWGIFPAAAGNAGSDPRSLLYN